MERENTASLPQLPTINRPRTLPSWVPERWYAHVVLWIACIIVGFPLFYAVMVSTQNQSEVFAYKFTPGSSLLDNLDVVINGRHLQTYMLNSIFISIVVTTGKTILSLLAGLAFVYFRFPGNWIVFGFVLITLMMPTEVLLLALFRFVNSLGWSNTYLALIVPFLASATGTFFIPPAFYEYPGGIV